MLSERRQKVLAALIEEYVAHALPVGSRTIAEHYDLGVSSATVRNDLSSLEKQGLIEQPHTSAGRIPTDSGYRAFVDELLASVPEGADPLDQNLIRSLQKNANELDELLEKTTEAITQLTDCLSIVLPPSIVSLHVRQISLVNLSAHKSLMVVVCEDGRVLNRALECSKELSYEQLMNIQHTLNTLFAGKSCSDIKRGIDTVPPEALGNPITQLFISEFFACMREHDSSRAHSLGVSSLLKKPEFSHPEALLPIVEVLEDNEVLVDVLDDEAYVGGTMVRIGSENKPEQLKSVSVVAMQFGKDDGEGVVAVVGPTRMDYLQVIKVLQAARLSLRDV